VEGGLGGQVWRVDVGVSRVEVTSFVILNSGTYGSVFVLSHSDE
jgi:hypothetical protein